MSWIEGVFSFLEKITRPRSPMVKAATIKVASPNEVLAHEASKWVGTMSVGTNGGDAVERFQRAVNLHPTHENWCADFVIFCIREVESALHIQSPIYRSELCADLWHKSPQSMRISKPEVGAIVVWQHFQTSLGHTGIIESINTDGNLITIEGNTGPGVGVVRMGDGVYRRIRSPQGTVAMHVLGFLRPFS